MRKSLLLVLVVFLTALCAFALADTEFALEPCAGKISINEDTYIVLTPKNLANHPDLVSTLGKSQEDVLADWEARGVQLQAWTRKMDCCLEVIVIQDEDAKQYYDIEQQNKQVRSAYLKNFTSGVYSSQGFKIFNNGNAVQKPAWKKQKLGGNFVAFEYRRTVDKKEWRGVGRRTVRNGYTVFLDYQIFKRLPKSSDNQNLNKIANTVSFEKVEASEQNKNGGTAKTDSAVPKSSGLLKVTAGPPLKTNEATFTVEGTATPGSQLTGVLMRYSGNTPYRFKATAANSGNFKMKVTIPEEGLWLLTLYMDVNGETVAEKFFDTTTYSKTLIPVNFDNGIPSKLTTDELTISGVTSGGVQVQIIVTKTKAPDKPVFQKTITTNRTGVFKFTKIPTKDEAEYEITVVFSKKNFNTERVSEKVMREYSTSDTQGQTASKAIHPAYNTLVKKLDSYIKQTMVYSVYIVDIAQSGDDWIITTAQKKSNKKYSNYLIYIAQESPTGLDIGSKYKVYGTCVGPYEIQSEEEGITSYPGFEYLFFQ